MSTYPFICKICGKQSDETILDCDADDFCICRKGFGCNNQKESEQAIVFRKIYSTLIESGNICYPRGLKIKEIENFSFILPPFTRFVNFEDRKLKLSYIKREFIWYLKGDKFDTSIAKYAKMWKDFINEDGSINSNYGQYIFGNLNQFNYVFDCLLKDKDSRRAIIIILQPYHILNLKMKEVPCTYNLSFRIRKNKLNMSVKMRSQDAWFGFGSDIPCFSFIHEMLFVLLKEKYVNLQLGNYHHFVDSFHVYSQHFDLIEKISNDSIFHNIECPKINSADEVRFLLKCNFKNIPNNFEFTKWLTNLD
jgi:thymidylate synthase